VDRHARFRALFSETYPALRRYAHHRGLSRADSDDLVADVFTVAWRRFDDIPPGDPTPWLFGVARNVWRNGLRREKRNARLIERLPVPDVALPPEPSDDDELQRVRAAVASLKPFDREVLVLVAWDGLTAQQAALVLGCTPTAARVRLHRARTRLAEILLVPETNEQPVTHLHRQSTRKEVPDART
jgi:RNA polymerase sigma-70 factor (ECF subfamily)